MTNDAGKMRPGRPSQPRDPKRYRVHTRQTPHLWLHALDELEIGKAPTVRSEWRGNENDATIFTSNMYADEVARNAEDRGAYIVELWLTVEQTAFNLVVEFVDHFSGAKATQLGNGYAQQWYQRAKTLLTNKNETAGRKDKP